MDGGCRSNPAFASLAIGYLSLEIISWRAKMSSGQAKWLQLELAKKSFAFVFYFVLAQLAERELALISYFKHGSII